MNNSERFLEHDRMRKIKIANYKREVSGRALDGKWEIRGDKLELVWTKSEQEKNDLSGKWEVEDGRLKWAWAKPLQEKAA